MHNLQQVKDLYGNEFSDEVLRHVATRISDSLRRDEFANAVVGNGVPARLEFALGFVFCPQPGSDFDDLLRRAQIALAHARRSALDHAVYQLGQDEKHQRQIQVANRLPRAVEENGFTISYQPKYDFAARAVREVEALVRWSDEELGAVFSDEFIDDFGTGFSSLAQLKALPVQELKIDKSLVMRMDTEKDDRQIVRSTIEMARYLGLKVVAEGVENEQVLKRLEGMSCDAV